MFNFLGQVKDAITTTVTGVLESDSYHRFKENVTEATHKTAEELTKFKEQATKRLNEVQNGVIQDLIYITPKILIMSYPFSDVPTVYSTIGRDRHLMISQFLHEKHGGHFLILNLSDKHYDGNFFENSVVEFFSPGSPAPPLGLLFKIAWTMESWLLSDPENVVVLHCINGRGRTITAVSCFLAWSGFFPSPGYALDYVCEKKGGTRNDLLIPSQRRYIEYFSHILEGIKPVSTPYRLIRVIIFNKPKFLDFTVYNPILQILRNGLISYTSAESEIEENVVKFDTDCVLQGNILLRCRQRDVHDKWISLFRCGFHTGYIQNNILSLPISELDGPLTDKYTKFPSDFSVDLIFDETPPPEIKKEITAATDIYESVIGNNRSFWDEVNARKSRRSGDGTKATKQNLINSAFRISEESYKADSPDSKPMPRKDYLEELEDLEKEFGYNNDVRNTIPQSDDPDTTDSEDVIDLDNLYSSVMNDIENSQSRNVEEPPPQLQTELNDTIPNLPETITESEIKPNYHLDETSIDLTTTPSKVLPESPTPSKVLPDSPTGPPESFINPTTELSTITNEESSFDDRSLTFTTEQEPHPPSPPPPQPNQETGISFDVDAMMNDLADITETSGNDSQTNQIPMDLDDLENELAESLNH